MKEKEIIIPMLEVSYSELNDRQRHLVDMAREATGRSYAPYSKFRVGAAIELDNGQIVTGSNQENAAFPSGTCAERTAAYYAHATYPDARFKTIAIAAVGTDGHEIPEPVAPCGACRQVIADTEKRQGAPIRILMCGPQSTTVAPSAAALLPFMFELK